MNPLPVKRFTPLLPDWPEQSATKNRVAEYIFQIIRTRQSKGYDKKPLAKHIAIYGVSSNAAWSMFVVGMVNVIIKLGYEMEGRLYNEDIERKDK